MRAWSAGSTATSAKAGTCPHEWFAAEVARLDNMSGDIEALADRLAGIRSWAYIAHRSDWLKEPPKWAERTREVEARLQRCAPRAADPALRRPPHRGPRPRHRRARSRRAAGHGRRRRRGQRRPRADRSSDRLRVPRRSIGASRRQAPAACRRRTPPRRRARPPRQGAGRGRRSRFQADSRRRWRARRRLGGKYPRALGPRPLAARASVAHRASARPPVRA